MRVARTPEGLEMKLRVHENSLFAILWRSPWWISAAVALALIALANTALPQAYASYGYVVALPFAAMAMAAAWKQARRPSAAQVEKTLEGLRAMGSVDFLAGVENAYRRDGYAVQRFMRAGADFELSKPGGVALVSAKRWKAARTGVEPLRELHAAARSREAQERIYITTGEISEKARAFAAEKNIRLVHGEDLAKLLARA
jgi:restriction system protein